jgi:hypothetical protein
MRAVSGATSGARHLLEVGLQALLVAAIVAALVLVGAVATGAAPGGADAVFAGRGTTTYSTISLAGTSAARIQYTRGSDVRFDTKLVGLKGGEYPMVYLACYSADTGKLLYGQLDHPDETFVLGGGSSDWWQIDPAPGATCYAHLRSYGGKTIRELTDPKAGILEFTAAPD